VNLADKIVMRPLASLVPYSSNARTHTPAQINLTCACSPRGRAASCRLVVSSSLLEGLVGLQPARHSGGDNEDAVGSSRRG
jgi:hypothetical protein